MDGEGLPESTIEQPDKTPSDLARHIKKIPPLWAFMVGLFTVIPGAITVYNNMHAPQAQPAPEKPSGLIDFQAGPSSDGFVWVRQGPSLDSFPLERLSNGVHIKCGDNVPDFDRKSVRFWRFCPSKKGYVAAKLLQVSGK